MNDIKKKETYVKKLKRNLNEVVDDEEDEVAEVQMIVKIKMIQKKKSSLYFPLPKWGSSSQNDKHEANNPLVPLRSLHPA